ncbi:MAG: hypothetical protein HQK92_07065 [Nitrospirae bacterium]|nr:hypothetical protein [Nitrospirota bacterium]
MSVTRSDISYVKPVSVTDTTANGGRAGYSAITNRQKHNLFPRVTRPERIDGKTRYRKLFLWNKNSSGETAASVLSYLIFPSPAGDRFYIAAGTQSDTQNDLNSSYNWAGGGSLNSAITAGAQQITILFENNDFYIDNGQVIVINSHILTSQTMDSDVKAFDSVYYNGSKWIKQTPSDTEDEDMYPYGTYLGSNKVFCYNTNGNLEYLTSQNNSYTAEVIGAGTGSQVTFAGTLTHTPVKQSTVVVKYTIGSVNYQATTNSSGTISGTSISSGTISNAGVFSITFSSAPDNSTNVTADYTEQSWSWSGNVLTVKTVEQVANSYSTSGTYCAVGLSLGDIKTSTDNKSISGSGTFDLTKLTLDNEGTIEDTWTFTFTSATAFTCSGTYAGSVGTGSINSTFTPNNANVGKKYFSVPTNAWGGTWATNDTLQFKTHPSKSALWLKEVVPAGTSAYSENGVCMELYVE